MDLSWFPGGAWRKGRRRFDPGPAAAFAGMLNRLCGFPLQSLDE
jgi:hypothetical protein